MQESGVAKSMDFISQEQALAAYGEQLLFFLEECYKLVALTQGFSKEEISQISVSGISKGNYILKVSQDDKVATQKLIIQ